MGEAELVVFCPSNEELLAAANWCFEHMYAVVGYVKPDRNLNLDSIIRCRKNEL